jgi:hypothetical protein
MRFFRGRRQEAEAQPTHQVLTAPKPKIEELQEALRRTGLLGKDNHKDAFYRFFIESVATRKMTATSLVIDWSMAGYDFGCKYPPHVRMPQVNDDFDIIVRAIAPKEIAEMAIDIMNQSLPGFAKAARRAKDEK